jgi:hypothetical protein
MTVLIQLTTAGTDTGPFNLYSNLDSFGVPFEVGVTKVDLLAGYLSTLVPNGTTTIKVCSTSLYCANCIDITIEPLPTTTTTSSSSTSSTTTSSTSTSTSTTTSTTTIGGTCKSYSITNNTGGTSGLLYTDCCTGEVITLSILDGQTVDDIHYDSIPSNPGLTITNLIDPYICPPTTTTTTTV